MGEKRKGSMCGEAAKGAPAREEAGAYKEIVLGSLR